MAARKTHRTTSRKTAATSSTAPTLEDLLRRPGFDADRARSLAIICKGLARALAENDQEMADFARQGIIQCLDPKPEDVEDVPLLEALKERDRARRGKVA